MNFSDDYANEHFGNKKKNVAASLPNLCKIEFSFGFGAKWLENNEMKIWFKKNYIEMKIR